MILNYSKSDTDAISIPMFMISVPSRMEIYTCYNNTTVVFSEEGSNQPILEDPIFDALNFSMIFSMYLWIQCQCSIIAFRYKVTSL